MCILPAFKISSLVVPIFFTVGLTLPIHDSHPFKFGIIVKQHQRMQKHAVFPFILYCSIIYHGYAVFCELFNANFS